MVCVVRQGPYRCQTTSDSGRVRACGGSSIITRKRIEMKDALTLLAVLALWWVVQVWLLPRFGVPT